MLHSLHLLYCSAAHRDLHSFPTRRSSDLVALASDDRDVDAHQRADVTIALTVGPDDLDHLPGRTEAHGHLDRKSTRLNSSHSQISYAVFCLKKKIIHEGEHTNLSTK